MQCNVIMFIVHGNEEEEYVVANGSVSEVFTEKLKEGLMLRKECECECEEGLCGWQEEGQWGWQGEG